MSAHAFMSPSAFKTARYCPAAPLRQYQVDQRIEFLRLAGPTLYGFTHDQDAKDRWSEIMQVDNDAAEDGTKLHSVFEQAIQDGITSKEDIRQMIVEQNLQGDMKEDEFVLSRLTACINEQLEQLESAEWVGVEAKIRVIGLPQYGTIDLTWLITRILFLRDLKTGYLQVDSEYNDQLMNYGVGVLDELDAWEDVDEIRIKILGIRFEAEEWVCSIDDLRKYKIEVMFPTFEAAYAINPVARQGSHCQYCSAKLYCLEWNTAMNKVVDEYFDSDFDDLTNEELVHVFTICKQADRARMDASRELLMAFEGFDAPTGVARVEGKQRTDYVVEEGDVIKALKKQGVAKKDMVVTKLLTATQMYNKFDGDVPKGIIKQSRNAAYLRIL